MTYGAWTYACSDGCFSLSSIGEFLRLVCSLKTVQLP